MERSKKSRKKKSKRVLFGALPLQYKFTFNPYPDNRLWRCPSCEVKTGQRKVPLVIHVDPLHLVTLNYTCRYCKHCDLLFAHKHEVEHLLTAVFAELEPEAIGNPYLVLGTMEKKAWRKGMKEAPLMLKEAKEHIHDFKKYLSELRLTRGGWYPEGVEPPVMEPPPSEEWVKS